MTQSVCVCVCVGGGGGVWLKTLTTMGPLGSQGRTKQSGPVMHTDCDVAAFVTEIDGYCMFK